MVGENRDNTGYEALRHQAMPSTPSADPSPQRAQKRDRGLTVERAMDAMQPPLDRPALGTPSNPVSPTKANNTTPQNRSSHHASSSFESANERETFPDRQSQESRHPLLNSKRFSALSNQRPASLRDQQFPDEGDDADREYAHYFSKHMQQPSFEKEAHGRGRSNSASASLHPTTSNVNMRYEPENGRDPWRTSMHGNSYREDYSPGSNHARFPDNRGRSMSFYDIKEQARQAKQVSFSADRPLYHNRNSSRSTGEETSGYADMIGGNRYPPVFQKARYMESDLLPMRLPWTMWMNSDIKNHFVASIGEWVGTTMFLFFAFAGTQVANAKSATPAESTTTNATTGFDPAVMLYISLSFGFSLMVNVWIFFRISGGLFNPAVTLALFATRAIGAWRAVCLFVAQIVGSITASALVLAIFPTPLNVRTTLSAGTSKAQGLFIEAFMTAELVFTILMLAKEKHKATFIAPVGIGLALFVAELVGVYYTGGSLNPARSLGPCVVSNTYDADHWIYWLGPAIGCLVAIGFYKFIKILEYEMANPGQDGDEQNDPTKNPNHEVREKQRETTARVLQALGLDNGPAGVERAPPPVGEKSPARSCGSANGDVERGYGGFGWPGGLSTVASMSEAQSPSRTYVPPARVSPRSSMQE